MPSRRTDHGRVGLIIVRERVVRVLRREEWDRGRTSETARGSFHPAPRRRRWRLRCGGGRRREGGPWRVAVRERARVGTDEGWSTAARRSRRVHSRRRRVRRGPRTLRRRGSGPRRDGDGQESQLVRECGAARMQARAEAPCVHSTGLSTGRVRDPRAAFETRRDAIALPSRDQRRKSGQISYVVRQAQILIRP